MVEAAEEAVSASTSATSTVSGLIRVAAPKSLANQVLRPIFVEFIKHYPDIQLHLKVTDLVLDPIHDAIDFLIHINDRPIKSLVNIKLGKVGQVLCASPDYLQINPTPLHPDDLKKHACICLGENATDNRWQLQGNYHGDICLQFVQTKYMPNKNRVFIDFIKQKLSADCYL